MTQLGQPLVAIARAYLVPVGHERIRLAKSQDGHEHPTVPRPRAECKLEGLLAQSIPVEQVNGVKVKPIRRLHEWLVELIRGRLVGGAPTLTAGGYIAHN